LEPAKAFSLKLMCGLASIMLVLTTFIVVDAVRRWFMILSAGPAAQVDLAAPGRPAP
jgi:hypothetical protein